jgi:hypothetical protein
MRWRAEDIDDRDEDHKQRRRDEGAEPTDEDEVEPARPVENAEWELDKRKYQRQSRSPGQFFRDRAPPAAPPVVAGDRMVPQGNRRARR